MAWAIITIYTSKCAQMDPQQLPKTSKFYSRCKKCDIEKTLGGMWYHSPLVARRFVARGLAALVGLYRVMYTGFELSAVVALFRGVLLSSSDPAEIFQSCPHGSSP